METPTLLGLLEELTSIIGYLAISKGPKGVGVSLPSPEDGNRISFRNAVFSNCLEPVFLSVIHHRQDLLNPTKFGIDFCCFQLI
jgi:hypothetical protein